MEKSLSQERFYDLCEKVANLYKEHYVFIYNIYISFFQEKPIEPLLEIEKAFAHLMQAILDLKNQNTQRALRNLDRFKGHIERLLLDLYKLTIYSLYKRAEEIENGCKKFAILTKISTLYSKVRELELQNIGSTITEEKTKEEIFNKYRELLQKIVEIFEKEIR